MSRHIRLPSFRKTIWKPKALAQLAQFTTDSSHIAWRRAMYWGRVRHIYAWRLEKSDAIILSLPEKTSWRIAGVWSMGQWERFVTRQEQQDHPARHRA